MAISKSEILMGREVQYPLNPEQQKNLDILLVKMNKVRDAYGKPMSVSSGYRPAAINAGVSGAAKNSSHTLCMACDIKDPDGSVRKWVLANLQLMKDLGLWIEDFRWTPTWVHFQIRPASRRIFMAYDPAKQPMTAPNVS